MIITHTSPDWDAIGAVWCVKRLMEIEEDVVFVNTGTPDPALLESASAVVDTGRVHDAAHLRFDHHQFAGAAASATSATELAFNAAGGAGKHPWLVELIGLITDADGRNIRSNVADVSRHVGIHSILSAWKARRMSDAEIMARGLAMLDDIEATLRARYDAAASVRDHLAWKSSDGRVWALSNAPRGATAAAFDEGAVLVVFANTNEPETVAVGIQRASESNIDCGAVVERAMAYNNGRVAPELARWFRHPAGFFAGRGTAKAPDATPLTVDFTSLAMAIAAAL